MRIAYLLLANHAEIAPDGRINLLGGDFNTLGTLGVPFVMPFFYVVGKACFDPPEVGQEVPFRLRVLDPDRNPLATPQMDSMIVPLPSNEPVLPASSGLMILIQNCEFTQFGNYTLTFGLGDLPEVELPLRIQCIAVQQP